MLHKTNKIVLCAFMSLWSICVWSANGKVIYIATDIHVMDSSLVINEGSAMTNYLAQDRKMLSQSTEAFQAVIDSAISHQADVLLICGDLTKDGEKIGHERVSRMLGKALQAGIKTFVIPGNHDIRNPFAKYFDGDKTSPAEGITAEGDIYIAPGLKISYVGQDTSSLKGPLYDIAGERGCDKTIFSTILIKMGFTKEMLYRDVSALSLGQKKFVMIALSLCEHADLYLWDEPLNYIDVYMRQEIERLVKDNNVTMLFVEHDRTFSESVADREVQI